MNNIEMEKLRLAWQSAERVLKKHVSRCEACKLRAKCNTNKRLDREALAAFQAYDSVRPH